MNISSKILTLLMVFVVTLSCAKESNQNDSKVRVLSSFSIITQIVNAVGGDFVAVHNLVPIGTDPHNYSPQPDDIKFAASADLFIYNGLNLEGGDSGWFMRLIKSTKADMDKVFKVSENVEPMYLSERAGNKEVNPHAFISPQVGILMADAIKDALISVNPENSEYYLQRSEEYIQKLREIDLEYQNLINSIPENKRVFFASEQAFQYLTAHYGLKEGFIWAIDTDENGSPEQIKSAIKFVRENKPPVLFVESNVDTRPMETVSKETGVSIYSPAIYSDELGKPGQVADTYLKYLEYNIKHIYNGLTQ